MKQRFSNRIENLVDGDLQDTVWWPPVFESAIGHFIKQLVGTTPAITSFEAIRPLALPVAPDRAKHHLPAEIPRIDCL
jgi:hypothetical protein